MSGPRPFPAQGCLAKLLFRTCDPWMSIFGPQFTTVFSPQFCEMVKIRKRVVKRRSIEDGSTMLIFTTTSNEHEWQHTKHRVIEAVKDRAARQQSVKVQQLSGRATRHAAQPLQRASWSGKRSQLSPMSLNETSGQAQGAKHPPPRSAHETRRLPRCISTRLALRSRITPRDTTLNILLGYSGVPQRCCRLGPPSDPPDSRLIAGQGTAAPRRVHVAQ